MKTNVLKSGLSTFAFALAIVASFAFSSMEKTAVTEASIQQWDPLEPCVETSNPDSCIITVNGYQCTVYGDPIFLYEEDLTGQSTRCILPLYYPY